MKLLQRVRDVALRRHLAETTIACYQLWIEQFLRFCRADEQWRHPRELGAADVGAFLTRARSGPRCSRARGRTPVVLAPPGPRGVSGKTSAGPTTDVSR